MLNPKKLLLLKRKVFVGQNIWLIKIVLGWRAKLFRVLMGEK